MPRIYASLAIADGILFLAAGGFGLTAAPETADRHVLLSVLALLLSAMIQVLAFMYLAVGGKIARQAAHLGGIEPVVAQRANEYRARTTPIVGLVILSYVVAVATGAIAWRSGLPAGVHLLVSAAVLAIHVWAWTRQYGTIYRFGAELSELLSEYHANRV